MKGKNGNKNNSHTFLYQFYKLSFSHFIIWGNCAILLYKRCKTWVGKCHTEQWLLVGTTHFFNCNDVFGLTLTLPSPLFFPNNTLPTTNIYWGSTFCSVLLEIEKNIDPYKSLWTLYNYFFDRALFFSTHFIPTASSGHSCSLICYF